MTAEKLVYLMRGLPCCGKSHTARRMAGPQGIVLETDEYFYTCVGDDPTRYDWSRAALPAARQWNFERFQQAVAAGASPIVVDRGNDVSRETLRYVRQALDHGYRVEFREPESAWWQEIRILLKYRPDTRRVLYAWADRLAEMSQVSHRVPASVIRKGMDQWKLEVTVADILALDQRAGVRILAGNEPIESRPRHPGPS